MSDPETNPRNQLLLRNATEIEAIRHAFYYYGYEGGYEPGSFTTKLMDAIAHADLSNRAKLWAAFPELVSAMAKIMDQPNAEAELRRRLNLLEYGPSN